MWNSAPYWKSLKSTSSLIQNVFNMGQWVIPSSQQHAKIDYSLKSKSAQKAAALSDSVFLAMCTNALTYLLRLCRNVHNIFSQA